MLLKVVADKMFELTVNQMAISSISCTMHLPLLSECCNLPTPSNIFDIYNGFLHESLGSGTMVKWPLPLQPVIGCCLLYIGGVFKQTTCGNLVGFFNAHLIITFGKNKMIAVYS